MAAPEIDVRYVAQLARLQLTEDEVRTFQDQLGQIVDFVASLGRVDVSGVEPTAHTSDVWNVFREDVAKDSFTAAEALANAPRQANGLFSVTKVLE